MIETKDLILRQGSIEDGPVLYQDLWSRPEVFRYLFSRPSPDPEAGMARTAAYAQMHKEVGTEFFVCEKATGEAIGIAGIKELSPNQWTVTDVAVGPAFQGKGYGKQIVAALLSLAFETHAADEVSYDCFAENTASRALALACGFSYDRAEVAELQKNGNAVILDHYLIAKPIRNR